MKDTPKTSPPSSKNPSSSLVLIGRLWKDYLSKYWVRLCWAMVAMAVLAITVSAMPFVIEAITAAIDPPENIEPNARFRFSLDQVIRYGPIVIAVIGGGYGISQYTQSRLSLGVALDVLQDLQTAMFDQFLRLDLARQQWELTGALASRFTNDVTIMRETLTRVANGVRDFLQLVGLCVTMLYLAPLLFFTAIGVYILLGWPIALLGRRLRKTAMAAQAKTSDVAAAITQSAGGGAMVKTYGLEHQERTRIHTLFQGRTDLLKKAAFVRAINEPLIFFVGSVAMGLVIGVIGWRIQSGALNSAELVGFIVALLLLSQPARGLSTLYAVVQEGLAAFERILAIIDSRPEIQDQDRAEVLNVQAADITFDQVSFVYEDGTSALTDISLSISQGQTVALVGESGAGKTTLMHLLPRLYEVTSGQVTINGKDIRALTLMSLRQSIAIVSQDAILFDDTVRNNIAYGKTGATQDDIVNAAKAASAYGFIENLQGGYDMMVGEGGARLSGGQRQRIAIARAFLKDAPILLLDEPTAALDAESEAAIQGALTTLQKNRTTLIIAHRLATVRSADKIIVMDRGRIIEMGTHKELLEKDNAYARLVKLQFDL